MSDSDKIQTRMEIPNLGILKQIYFGEDMLPTKILSRNDFRKPYYAIQEKGPYVITVIFKQDGERVVEEGFRDCGPEEVERKKRYPQIYSANPWLEKWLQDSTSGLIEPQKEQRKEIPREEAISIVKKHFPRFLPRPEDKLVVVGIFDYVKDAQVKVPNRVKVKYDTTQKAVLKTLVDYGTKRGDVPKITYVFGELKK